MHTKGQRSPSLSPKCSRPVEPWDEHYRGPPLYASETRREGNGEIRNVGTADSWRKPSRPNLDVVERSSRRIQETASMARYLGKHCWHIYCSYWTQSSNGSYEESGRKWEVRECRVGDGRMAALKIRTCSVYAYSWIRWGRPSCLKWAQREHNRRYIHALCSAHRGFEEDPRS